MLNEPLSGIIAHMQEKPLNWEWNGENSKFRAEEFDPSTGVRTTWEKDNNGLLSRREKLPSGPSRYGLSFGSDWLRCNVHSEDVVDGVYKDIEITGRDEDEAVRVGLHDPEDRLGLAALRYDPDGKFRSFSVTMLGGRTKDTPGIPHFLERPFGENLSELAEIIRYRGLVVMTNTFQFGESEDEAVEKELQTNQEMESIEMLSRGWKPEVLEEITQGTHALLEPLMDTAFGDSLSSDDREVFLRLVQGDVFNLLRHDYQTLPDPDKFFEMQRHIETSIAMALGYYYGRPNMLDNMHVNILPHSSEEPDRFDISIHESPAPNSQVISSGEIARGEVHRYGPNDFSIRREGDQIIVGIQTRLKPHLGVVLEIPEYINSAEIIEIAKTDQNIGWERALDLVSVNLS